MSACDEECNLVEKSNVSQQTNAAASVYLISKFTRSVSSLLLRGIFLL